MVVQPQRSRAISLVNKEAELNLQRTVYFSFKKPALKIAIISKSDSLGGGASRVAEDLAFYLNQIQNVKAHHWMGYPGRQIHTYTQKLFGGRIFSQVHRLCRTTSRIMGFPDFFTPELYNLYFRKNSYDIYHFHDISTTFSPLFLNWLAHRKPVIWTIHDCSPFTGGCIFPEDCKKYLNKCGNCPQLGEWPMLTRLDFTGPIQNYKKKMGQTGRINFVFPSQWIADEATKCGLTHEDPLVIPYFVNTEVFRPIDKSSIRSILGLPTKRFIVLISAWSIATKRKGFLDAVEAVRHMKDTPYLLVVGNSSNELVRKLDGFEYRITGYINNDRFLAQYYAAADIFLFPTLADNLPNSILETMSSGTAPVTYRTGGIPEMVDHNESGWLATTGSVDGLVEGLNMAHGDPNTLRSWQNKAREKVLKDFRRDTVLDKYVALYKQLASGPI